MFKFYILLWAGWAVRLTFFSVFWASLFSVFVTAFLYVSRGSISLSTEVIDALLEIFRFAFPIIWSITILVALFRSLKFLFNRCIAGYELKLLSCDAKAYIEPIGYGDLLKVWRRWLFVIIWISATQMLLATAILYFIDSNLVISDWFNIYLLYGFVMISGYFSFIVLAGRCKSIKVLQC